MDNIDLIFVLLFLLYFMWPVIWGALKALLAPKRGDLHMHHSPVRKEKQAEAIWGSKTKKGGYEVYDRDYVSEISHIQNQKLEPEVRPRVKSGVKPGYSEAEAKISSPEAPTEILSSPIILENNKELQKVKKKPIFQTVKPRGAFLYKELLDRPLALRKKPVFRAD